jgi:hypothetical protein
MAIGFYYKIIKFLLGYIIIFYKKIIIADLSLPKILWEVNWGV